MENQKGKQIESTKLSEHGDESKTSLPVTRNRTAVSEQTQKQIPKSKTIFSLTVLLLSGLAFLALSTGYLTSERDQWLLVYALFIAIALQNILSTMKPNLTNAMYTPLVLLGSLCLFIVLKMLIPKSVGSIPMFPLLAVLFGSIALRKSARIEDRKSQH
ncbi:MAG: hypothetical protein K2Z81_15695 [Cyanobacteria bacterium]|nr:hypothetical protein [Cyanobacteriota bacterium]